MASISVLGGGISGLTTAYYLSKLAPNGSKIALIEGSNRLGGWIRSSRVNPGHYGLDRNVPESTDAEVTDENKVLFEAGPRSLRPVGPGGILTLEMVSCVSAV